MSISYFLIICLILLGSPRSFAECISLIKGPVALDVKSCGRINPEKSFDVGLPQYRFIKDFPPKERKEFLDSYRGLFVKALVARSLASKSGLSEEKGVLNGEVVDLFFPPGVGSCGEISKRRLKAQLEQACCEGGGDPPCLLTSDLVITDFKVIGKTASGAGNKTRRIAKKSDLYKKADSAYRRKSFEESANLFEMVKATGQLDLNGYYKLGHSYRELDLCRKAVPPLKFLYSKYNQKQFWAEEEKALVMGVFMLARCYSKLNEPGFATQILEGYLLDPEKNKGLILRSLKHPDFGWIKTTKEFRQYKKAALKMLEEGQ